MRRIAVHETRARRGYRYVTKCFVDLYSDFAKAVVARLCHKSADEIQRPFPAVEDGIKGLAFVEAAVRSSASGRWEPVEYPAI